MEINKIKSLVNLIQKSGISELEVTEGDLRVRIVKSSLDVVGHGQISAASAPVLQQPQQVVMPSSQVPEGVSFPGELEVSPQPDAAPLVAGKVVKSPMVGTFYRASSPSAPSFVQMGDTVKTGDVLGIIEAMKLMNEIESDFGGRIKEIYVESGQPVEYGQPLFLIV